MIPANWDLHHLASKSLHQEEDFRVKAKAIHALEFKGSACGSASEEFEAALRIVDLEAGKNPDQ
jgi:hypothetical protein